MNQRAHLGDLLQLTLDSLAFGGEAVGRAPAGQAVFVPFGAPGDEIEVRITQVERRFLRGAITRIVHPGPSRITPLCPYASRCGGCQWQHVDRQCQTSSKQAIVERSLRGLNVAPLSLLTPTPTWGYRTRVRLSVGNGIIGLHAWRSHEVLPITSCLLLHPQLDLAIGRAIQAFQDALPDGSSLSALMGTGAEGPCVQLATEAQSPALQARARALLDGSAMAGILLGNEAIGAAEIDLSLEGEPRFMGRADGFAQASSEGNRTLRQHLHNLLPPSCERILELYAGDGNLTRELVTCAREVVAVESTASAKRLSRNAPGVTVVEEDALSAVRRLSSRGARFDLVVLDPPRTGASELMPLLARLTNRIIYISCDPMTLARDAQTLRLAGFVLEQALPIDLMPHTYHIELIANFLLSA